MISQKELKSLVRTMHSLGVISLKTPEIELVIQPKQPQVRRKRQSPMQDVPIVNIQGFGGYSDEEVLAWSSSPVVNQNEETEA